MKQKANKIPQLHLQYLFEVAQKLPLELSKRKSIEFLQLSKKLQVRIGKTKRIMCSKCNLILIPKLNCETFMEKRGQGFGLHIKCLKCDESKFIIKK